MDAGGWTGGIVFLICLKAKYKARTKSKVVVGEGDLIVSIRERRAQVVGLCSQAQVACQSEVDTASQSHDERVVALERRNSSTALACQRCSEESMKKGGEFSAGNRQLGAEHYRLHPGAARGDSKVAEGQRKIVSPVIGDELRNGVEFEVG